MKVIIGSDKAGFKLKEIIKNYLIQKGYTIVDVTTEAAEDFVASTSLIVSELEKDAAALGIAIDAYGAGSFMSAVKHKGMVAAEVSDERSAYMTRQHNNARMITLGSEIVGEKLAESISEAFLSADYDGGRHQIRVDMLNKMC